MSYFKSVYDIYAYICIYEYDINKVRSLIISLSIYICYKYIYISNTMYKQVSICVICVIYWGICSTYIYIYIYT